MVFTNRLLLFQATIDACAEQGWLVSTLRAQQIMQMVIQARWIEESPLLTLPHIESHHLYLFSLMSRSLKKQCTFPAGLKMACLNNYEALAVHLREEFDDNEIEQIYKVNFSNITFSYTIFVLVLYIFLFFRLYVIGLRLQ